MQQTQVGSAGVGEQPSFAWKSAGPELLWDSVAFTSSGLARFFEFNAEVVNVVDLDDAVRELTGDASLTCVGFSPDEDPRKPWPYFPPAHACGPHSRRHQGHILADFAAPKGFSGGPVFTGNGQFAGMLTGVDSGVDSGGRYSYARIVPAGVLKGLTAHE